MHALNLRSNINELYYVDVSTLKAEKFELSIDNLNSCFIEGEYMLVIRFDRNIAIYKDLEEIG